MYAAISRSAILRASAYAGRSVNPVKLSAGSRPRKVSDVAGRRPEAKYTGLRPSASCSRPAATAARTMFELKAPARPRSPAISISPTLFTWSCSWRIGSLGTLPAASAAWRVIRRIAFAYGRSASIRCSARRRRAAATISIARVIFWMFLTAPMRFLTSRCVCGMSRAQAPGSRRLRLILLIAPVVVPPLALRAARRTLVAFLDRMPLLVEVEAEVLGEARDRLLDRLLRLLAPVAPGDLLEEIRLAAPHGVGEVGEEAVEFVHHDSVQVPAGRRVYLDHLVLDGHRMALCLVERLDQPLAAGELSLRLRIELRAELRERLE